MKVSFFAFDIFSPTNTAGYVHTSEMTKELSRFVDVQLFVAPTRLDLANLFKWRNGDMNYARFTLWPKWYLAPALPINLVSYYSVSKKVEKFKPDLIHERFHSPNPFGCRISNKLKIPRVLEVNSPYVEDEAYSGVWAKLCKMDRRVQFDHADAIIVQTETLKGVIECVTDKPIYVVPNGVNTEQFKPMPDNISFPGKVVVAFSGSFQRWHGTHLLKEIESMLPDNVRFLLLGTDKSDLKDAICLGDVDHKNVPRLLSSADICIAPFDASEFPYFEKYGFWWSPLKLYEYMAMCKPVVSFDYPEIRKIVGDGGLLAKVGDVQDFADKVRYLVEKPEERERIGKRAREIALDCGWDKRARETHDVYRDVMESFK